MSKTIKIPSGIGNPVDVVLNGIKYSYPAGSMQTVPDEVAALIESNERQAVVYGRRASAPLEATERKGSAEGVPVQTDDEGRLYVPAAGIAHVALSDAHVEGHRLILRRSTEE